MLDSLMARLNAMSENRVARIHALAKRIWTRERMTCQSLQESCIDAWDLLHEEIGSRIVPLVQVSDNRQVTNVIFGSGGFSTGAFQAEQFQRVKGYTPVPPVKLAGIVANKSKEGGCNAAEVAKKYNIPLVELDFATWYRNNIDAAEKNPVAASRYWYARGDPTRPDNKEIARRFSIRQDRYHAVLGELIEKKISGSIDVASARGYNFQFCSSLFKVQARKPHVNDTHPADLTFVDPKTKEKLYPGWQAGAVQLMLSDKLTRFRGSLIEVGYMDRVAQIDELDEGALLVIGEGVVPGDILMNAGQIQSAMKIIDDFTFCTLEPTGLLLAWGKTEKPVKVIFQDKAGNPVEVLQHAIVVGNEICSGRHAWGSNFDHDLNSLEKFVLKG